jgi:hypothetical protein
MTKIVDLFCLKRRNPKAEGLTSEVALLSVRPGSVLPMYPLYQVGEEK